MGWIRRTIKRIAARHMLIIEYCHDCGVKQPLVWKADEELWASVTGKTDGSGILCPKCFDIRAEKIGILVYWVASVQPFQQRQGGTR